MISLFSIPKAMEGHEGVIQRNAFESWRRLHPDVEVFLCGDDPGVAGAARELSFEHLPAIDRTEHGTPLLRSAFAQVARRARHPVLVYVNADILLLSDFIPAIQQITLDRYITVGQRWNLDVDTPLDFERDDWEVRLRARVDREAELNEVAGMDYFVMPRPVMDHLLQVMPDFVVGRPYWDTWMAFHTRSRHLPFIDATPSILAVHQNHGYGHVPERRITKWERKWHGPEGDRNQELAFQEGKLPLFGTRDATWILRSDGLHRAMEDDYLETRVHRQKVLLRPKFFLPDYVATKVMHLFVKLYARRERVPEEYWRRFFYYCTW
ncbi:MAG: hypothetical protein GVY18_16730 [Bacteroidetes bacterium]|nr:hypothetical protein [Bacteroidota bacterium]